MKTTLNTIFISSLLLNLILVVYIFWYNGFSFTKEKVVIEVTTSDSPYLNEKFSLEEDKKNTYLYGDIEAYDRLYFHYVVSEATFELFLPWALIMANKHNYKNAYYDVYFSIISLNYYIDSGDYRNLDNLDNTTRYYALEYLKTSVKMGFETAYFRLLNYVIDGKYIQESDLSGPFYEDFFNYLEKEKKQITR